MRLVGTVGENRSLSAPKGPASFEGRIVMPDELERLHKQLVHQRQPKKSRMADALTMRPTRLQSSAYGASQSGADCPTNPQ